jgi:hypothetical protein
MNLTLLQEGHNFKDGNNVAVYERYSPDEKMYGTIYKIINLPANKDIKEYANVYIDYFYVKFSKEVYNKILTRGSKIIYNHKPEVVGNIVRDNTNAIQKIYIQYPFVNNETKIELENINSMLVWREAYVIE